MSTEDILTTLETNVIMNFVIVSTATLISFDHLITIQQELDLFWKKRVTLSSILFCFNRYTAIVYYVVMLPIRFYPSFTHEYGPFMFQLAAHVKQSLDAL
ncbi:hypothetical protein BD309DRAFT_1023060 [Dichomitus squalens]|nr:hypothetical protein BD309DRAFT_1023060 [Dichomitus squalens]